MNQSAEELLIYLEQSLVLDQGFVNIREMSKANLQTIWLWHEEGLLELKKINFLKKNFGPYTHKVRFSRELYERSWEIRRQTAEKHSPTLNPDKQKTWTPDRDHAAAPAEQTTRKVPDYEPHFEGFKNFLSIHKNEMTPPQEQLARELFPIFEQQRYRFFMHARKTGKSWLLKAIDQYLTSLKKIKPVKKKKS